MVSSPEIAAALPLATMENVPEEISSAITEQTSSQNLYKEIPANSATAWGLSKRRRI